jgi:hypothetical protein
MSDLSSDKISNIEADCYWCLTKLLDGMQDHYTFAQPGIQRLVFKLKELVRRIDGTLFSPGLLFSFKHCYNFMNLNASPPIYGFHTISILNFSVCIFR